MKIILVQAEIELALRAYVLNQIAVKDGQDINITFKNTRGDDGATAEIDITTPSISSGSTTTVGNGPQKLTEPVKESVSPVQATKTAQTTVRSSTASPAPVAEAISSTPSEPKQSVQAASSTTEPTAQASTEVQNSEPKEEEFKVPSFLNRDKTAEASAENVPVTKPSATEAPAPSKSLFANLTKPVNPKPLAEE